MTSATSLQQRQHTILCICIMLLLLLLLLNKLSLHLNRHGDNFLRLRPERNCVYFPAAQPANRRKRHTPVDTGRKMAASVASSRIVGLSPPPLESSPSDRSRCHCLTGRPTDPGIDRSATGHRDRVAAEVILSCCCSFRRSTVALPPC